MSQTQEIQFSNDLGNGTLKGIINGEPIAVPSYAAKERAQDVEDPIKSIDNPEGESYVSNYLDHMDVSVQSSAIKHSDRCLVGKRAVSSRLALDYFDIASMSYKSDTDLAIILTLSTIAGKALEYYYKRHHQLPSQDIPVNVDMVTALPIIEGKRPQAISNYARRYTKSDHQVLIRNFNNVITVKIHFNSVHVMLEGQAALYAVHFDNDNALRKGIYQDLASHYPEIAKNVHSYKTITDVNSVLGVDIGEGTTDLAVFNDDGSVNIQASESTPNGFGHAVSSAKAELHTLDSRPHIEQIMRSSNPNPFLNSKRSRIIRAINDQKAWLAKKIGAAVSDSLRRANGSVLLIYVYGGGSVPMEDLLRDRINTISKRFNKGQSIPVIFINKNYAQYMNVLGLYEVLKKLMSLK